MYTLRDQLKVQFRATQKAQVNERKAADSKRRLTSYVPLFSFSSMMFVFLHYAFILRYVFHEVRVPLNTARKSSSFVTALE